MIMRPQIGKSVRGRIVTCPCKQRHWNRYPCLFSGFLFLVMAALPDFAATIYVDRSIPAPGCNTYDPATRSCTGGTATAFATLTGAANTAQPGDIVLIRQGTYAEQFRPLNSGVAGNPITYRNYQSEEVFIASGSSPATIVLNQVSHIVIEGITVQDARWVEAVSCRHLTLRGNRFLRTPSSGTTGNVRFISSDHNRILDNLLDTGNDNLLLIDSDHNLVEGNTMQEGRHSVFSIRCSNFNVIRGNRFANTLQKIGEMYDCGEDTTAVPHAFDATKHNLIENNVFADATTYYSTSGGNGIQYAGQEGIIRRNVFYHTNVGLGMQVYSDEALYNHRNRVFHNVFYENDCAGMSVNGNVLDNVYLNNVFYKNLGIGGGDCFGDGPAQIVYRHPMAQYQFRRNDIIDDSPGQAVIQQEFGTGNTLAYFQAAYPALYVQNLEVLPGFADEAAFDFRLLSASPLIDAGAFLTQTTSGGAGTVLPVEDARYFCDGFGIAGLGGDRIRLDGQVEAVMVTMVDYAANTLTLDRAVAWTAGQGVALEYHGAAPDIGAFEFIPAGEVQSIALVPGWNWISFNVLPADRSLGGVFSGIQTHIEQVKTQTQSALRLNGQWVGDLADMNDIQTGKMYKVRVNAACTLTVTGTTIAPTTPISLVSGWNWAAYYPVAPQVIGTSLSSITGQAQQAKSQTQSTIFQNGQWLGDLTQMEPGKGYTILMSGPGNLIYPEGQ